MDFRHGKEEENNGIEEELMNCELDLKLLLTGSFAIVGDLYFYFYCVVGNACAVCILCLHPNFLKLEGL